MSSVDLPEPLDSCPQQGDARAALDGERAGVDRDDLLVAVSDLVQLEQRNLCSGVHRPAQIAAPASAKPAATALQSRPCMASGSSSRTSPV